MKNVVSTTKIDYSTGEITEDIQVKNFTVQTTTDKFYMTFIDFAAPLFDLKQGLDKALIAKLCCMAEFNTGIVKLTTQDRSDICKFLGISKQQLTNSLGRIKKLNLLSGSNGNFLINPKIFWKGDMKSRSEALKDNQIKMVFNFTAEKNEE